MKLQALQNKIFRTIDNFARLIPVREMHTDFHLPYVYDYITKLCKQQADGGKLKIALNLKEVNEFGYILENSKDRKLVNMRY
jgi:hypothetical protein